MVPRSRPNGSCRLPDATSYSDLLEHLLLMTPNMEESAQSPFFHHSKLVTMGHTLPMMGYISTDCILDMVMLHYIENDDWAFRAWIADTGYVTVRSDQTHLGFEVVKRWKYLNKNCISIVRKYQPNLAIQDCCPLFDGGILGPSIRRGLDQYDIGLHGKDRQPDFESLDIPGLPRNIESVPFWPERDPWPRHILWPQSIYRLRELGLSLSNFPWWTRRSVLDLSIRPGRGLNRDGHWSTGQPLRRRAADGRYMRERRRCTSEPPPGSFSSAEIPAIYDLTGMDIIFPRMTFSQIDRRSRSRSLSRTRIAEMFDWDINVPNLRDSPPPGLEPRCGNCFEPYHATLECTSPCGHCGVISPKALDILEDSPITLDRGKTFLGIHQNPHVAPHCPVAPKNRCKCVQFPTYHTAANCEVACHRNCGNTAPPGSARHPNAMLCKSRCCMCGIRGHSGKDCTNKTCRCGGHHLGQDCCWNPTCRVPGCDRFLCGIHCRECGSAEKPFKERRCWRCHGAEEPFQWPREKRRIRKTKQSGPEKDEGRVVESTDDRKNSSSPLDAPARGRSKTVDATVQDSIFGDPRVNLQG